MWYMCTTHSDDSTYITYLNLYTVCTLVQVLRLYKDTIRTTRGKKYCTTLNANPKTVLCTTLYDATVRYQVQVILPTFFTRRTTSPTHSNNFPPSNTHINKSQWSTQDQRHIPLLYTIQVEPNPNPCSLAIVELVFH